MKTRQLIQTTIKAGIFATALFCSASLFAQVKVGTAPTTIGANSNLEVEATNNKKVIVHKSDGTVIIENTPSGSILDSILTVDASGNVRAINKNKLKALLNIAGSAAMVTSGTQSVAAGGSVIPNFTTVITDELNGIDLTNDIFTIKADGVYTLCATNKELINGSPGQSAITGVVIQKLIGGVWTDIGQDSGQNFGTFNTLVTMILVDSFVVGDQVRVKIGASSGTQTGNPAQTLQSTKFFVLKNL